MAGWCCCSRCMGRGLLGLFNLFGPTRFLSGRVHIRFFGNGGLWFRPYGDSLFLTSASKKVSKKSARPERTAPRQGSGFLRSGIHPGASPPAGFARPPLDVFGCAERRCAPTPRMNASTQPAEGAGGSRSKAAGELTLGLMSGEERRGGVGCSAFALLWERRCGDPTCSRRRPVSRLNSHRRTNPAIRLAGRPPRFCFCFCFCFCF
jgi:hypothetical protein